jgi:acyl-CoA synthetase (AMP-forming)/AMP-acid ligase II
MRRVWVGMGLACLLLAAGATVWAATWGGITPGETMRRDVEARYGAPSRTQTVTEEGRTGVEWTYSGDRAPNGLERMVVSFGLVRGTAFVPDLVRALTLYPKPGVFRVQSLSVGWGKPEAIGSDAQTGRSAMRYDSQGLLVILDRTGEWAETMVFAPVRNP